MCLSFVLIAGCPSQQQQRHAKPINYSSAEEPLQALVSWMTSQLQSSASTSLSLVTPTLTNLMHCTEARLIFAVSGGVGYLSRHIGVKNKASLSSVNSRQYKGIGNGASVQQLYELCFCLWTLTYECNSSASVRTHFSRDNVTTSLVNIVARAPREKVVRVALSALRNLATCSAKINPSRGTSGMKARVIDGSFFLNEMIGAGLMKTLRNMKERQWTDPDIIDDLSVLYKLLHENHKEMSTYDVYKSEVETGVLSWGILHTENFFRENVRRLEGPNGDFNILKLLIVLAAGPDEDVAAIACFDIGEFVRHYPNGRAIAKRLGAKDVVMKLIDHKNIELQRHALVCVSKMMVQNWSALQ